MAVLNKLVFDLSRRDWREPPAKKNFNWGGGKSF